MTRALLDARMIKPHQELDRCVRDGAKNIVGGILPRPVAFAPAGQELRRPQHPGVGGGKFCKVVLRHLPLAGDRLADPVHKISKPRRLREQGGRQSRMAETGGCRRVQDIGMMRPFHDMKGFAQMLLMRGGAAARRRVREVKRELASNEMERSSTRNIVRGHHVTSKKRFAGVVNHC